MKMKWKILLIVFSVFCLQSSAQDVIMKRNGEELKAKVVEITETSIKYKQEDNLEGPLYNILKTDVFKVKYENGKSDFFGNAQQMEQSTETKAAIKKEVEAKFSTQSKYDSLMHLGKSNRAFGIVGCILGPVFVVSGGGLIIGALYEPNITVRNLYFGLGGVIMACGVAESIVGPIGLIKGKKQIDAAQQYKGQVSMTMPSLRLTDFSPRSGIGLGTRITF